MSEPFLGEIRLFANNYAPRNWMMCEGQILPINGYQALYSILGNVYGGDGKTTFALPDLRGRTAIHVSPNIQLGTTAGESAHTLTSNEMPQHTHTVSASSMPASQVAPTNNVWAAQANSYTPPASQVTMNAASMSSAGKSQAHPNMQPYTALNYCIAIQGIFPSRN